MPTDLRERLRFALCSAMETRTPLDARGCGHKVTTTNARPISFDDCALCEVLLLTVAVVEKRAELITADHTQRCARAQSDLVRSLRRSFIIGRLTMRRASRPPRPLTSFEATSPGRSSHDGRALSICTVRTQVSRDRIAKLLGAECSSRSD